MRKICEVAYRDLVNWLNGICYERAAIIDDCGIMRCKGCGEGGYLIKNIQHKETCEVKIAKQNLDAIMQAVKGSEDVCGIIGK